MKSLTEVLNTFESSFHGLRDTARLVIAVAATTRIERKHPVAVILVGGPSSGKTTVLMPLTRGEPGSTLAEQTLRVDDFSGASLVSHAANRTEEQLAKQDLLPMMKDKCVIVKELAPLFTGHEDELLRKFGIFASVLDGEGYVSSSGSHGKRGYSDTILFSLLGAVTPSVLNSKVIHCLNAVGPRFCFWEVPQRELDLNTWRGPNDERRQFEAQASTELTLFIDQLFDRYEPGSVMRSEFKMSDHALTRLSHIAALMASLRSKGIVEKDDEDNTLGVTVSPESPERAYRYLEQIVQASALSDGRFEIQDGDLLLALGLATGSAPPFRRKVVKALVESTGKLSTKDLSVSMKVCTDTAQKYAELNEKHGLIERVNVDGYTQWDLKAPYLDLRYLANPRLVPESVVRAVQQSLTPPL